MVGNIAGELKPEIRELLVKGGFVELSRKTLDAQTDSELVNNVGFFVGNIARTKPRLGYSVIKPVFWPGLTVQVLPSLCKCILSTTNVETLNNFLFTLGYITDSNDSENVNGIIELEMCEPLVKFCGYAPLSRG